MRKSFISLTPFNMLCSNNAKIGVDHNTLNIRFLDARRHVSAIVSLRKFRTINPHIPDRDIYLNSIPDTVSIDKDGTPLCMTSFRMVNWRYCRHIPQRYCSPTCGRVNSCTCEKSVLPLLTVSTPENAIPSSP